jgi:uncharacterized membrane protein
MKRLAAAIASALLMTSAYAQTSPATGAMAPTAASDARRDQAVEAHIRELHAQLKVTAAEEPKWEAVAKAMRASAVETDAAIDRRAAMIGSATAIDNLTSYADIAQAHVDGVRRLAAAFGPFYAALPDAQKKVADAVFAHRGQGGRKSGT